MATKKAATKKSSTKRAGSSSRSTKGSKKVGKVMHEFKHGQLKSSTGQKVKNPKQAIAIGLSEAREAGANIPKKGSSRKSAAKKSASTKKRTSATKKSSRSAAKKTATKKSTTKKRSSR